MKRAKSTGRMGRPSKYTDELAEEICRRIAEGEMLMQIVKDDNMPDRRTVYNWMEEREEFLHMYKRACELSADALVERGLEILDKSSPDCAQMDRNRAEFRKWLAGKRSSKYVERTRQDVGGVPGAPLEQKVILSPEQMAQLQEDEKTALETISRKLKS